MRAQAARRGVVYTGKADANVELRLDTAVNVSLGLYALRDVQPEEELVMDH